MEFDLLVPDHCLSFYFTCCSSFNKHFLYFQLPRRKSSGSVTSGSDDSDVEPSPPVVRRGRRSAIVDTKVSTPL